VQVSSGSDPHLLALLRAIRLHHAAPDADAGDADPAEAAASAQPTLHRPYPQQSGPPPAHSPQPVPRPEPPDPANADPFAQHTTPDQPAGDLPEPPGGPRVPPARSLAAVILPASVMSPGMESPATTDGPGRAALGTGPGGPTSSASIPAGSAGIPAGSAGIPPGIPAGSAGIPTGIPASSASIPPPGTPAGIPANPAFGGVFNGLSHGDVPTNPAQPPPSNLPLTASPPASEPASSTDNPASTASRPAGSDAFVPWAAASGPPKRRVTPQPPIIGGVVSGGAFEPVQAVAAVARAVPGQWPEQPNPGLDLPGVRPGGLVPGSPGPAPVPEAGLALPVDGMNPGDDAARREVQRLLGNSLSMAGGPEDVATRLWTALVQAQPRLMAMLPGGAQSQREQLAQALTWLVHHLDQPPALVAGGVQLGSALAECGVHPQQLTLVGAALAEAMRAGMAGGGLRQDFDQAWRTTWQHVHEWITHGAAVAAYQPITWLSVVESHELRRPDLAVVRFRPYLPMPFKPGQYARIEVDGLPGVWRPYSLAGAPRRDNIIELHVRAKTESGVSGTLVYRTKAGDKVRFGRAEGAMGLPEDPDRDLLMVAGDTGVAPLKALLTEMAATGDQRTAVLFWGVRNLQELYDMEDIARIARAARRVTVVPVISEGNPGRYASGLVTDAIAAYGEWSRHEVYLAGPPVMLAATSAALQQLGVAPERIHHDSPEG
jgi:NAD(P)H-flavin reductase/hemoglobin-like flavoprotein